MNASSSSDRRRKGKERSGTRHLQPPTSHSSSLSNFLETVSSDTVPDRALISRAKRPSKRRKVDARQAVKRYTGLVQRDSVDQLEEVAQISSCSDDSDLDEEHLLPDSERPQGACRKSPGRAHRVRRRRIGNRQQMLSVHGGTDVFQTSLSSGKQEPADNTDHVTSTGKKNVLKGNDLNVREALATTSSFAQLNKISTFLGDVKTDEEPKGEEDEGTIQESSVSESEDSPQGNKLSTSDWLKDQSLDTTRGHDLDKSITPSKLASAKKKSKYIKGGLAERLKHLTAQENSDIAFWEHSQKQRLKDSSSQTDQSKSPPLTVDVTAVAHSCALFIADCTVTNDRTQLSGINSTICGRDAEIRWKVCQSLEETLLNSNSVKVIFTKRTASFLHLGVGSTVHIYPPWYECCVSGVDATVAIFGTHYSIGVVQSESPILKPDHLSGKKYSKPRALFDRPK